jgi:periplasmic divalent cation tolerance protein
LEYIQVLMTVETRDDAEKIANALLDKRLAGCVQTIGPIISQYWWKGKKESSEEWLCLIKTRRTLYEELEQTIKQLHKYEVPEIIALPIVAGSYDYLEWLRKELKKKKDGLTQ